MSRRHFARGILVALCSIASAACVPEMPEAARPRAANTRVPRAFDEGPSGESSALIDWRAFFADERLTSLIDVALEHNQELNIAVQEMLVANNEIMARRGEYLPSLSAAGGAGIDRVGRYTSQGQNDERSEVASNLQNYSLGLYASWEVDVWGRLHNAADAAMYRYLASQEGRKFMVTRLIVEIVNDYYKLLALDQRLEMLNSNIALQQDSLEIVRAQQQAARVTMLAVQRFEAQLLEFRSRQFEIRQRIVETENHLNFLLGRFPQHVERNSADFLNATPPSVSVGAPMQLLENRPDVRRAELELKAAELDVSAARARFYPALRLDAAGGVQSFDARRLLTTPDSFFYNLFAGVAAPLLNRNAITAEYFSSGSRQMQAVLQYERAILSAYVDVDTGLNLVRNLAQSYALKAEQVEHLTQAVEISTSLFNSARADYLEVLTTRRDSLEAQMELIETKQGQFEAAVALYQALGGGWRRAEHAHAADTQAHGSNGGVTQ